MISIYFKHSLIISFDKNLIILINYVTDKGYTLSKLLIIPISNYNLGYFPYTFIYLFFLSNNFYTFINYIKLFFLSCININYSNALVIATYIVLGHYFLSLYL